MANVGIIGGGIVGLASSVALSRAGHRVTLFDRPFQRLEPSWANAGHIACEQVTPLASMDQLKSVPWRLFAFGGALDLPFSAIGLWAPFALDYVKACMPGRSQRGEAALSTLLEQALTAWQTLANDIQYPDLVRDSGHYVVWESPASTRRGRAYWSTANIGCTRFDTVTSEDLGQLVALTAAPIKDAIRFSGSGQIADLERLRIVLEDAFANSGGYLVKADADLVVEGRRALIGGKDFDEVLVSAGANSANLLKPVGHRVPLIAERGYHLRASLDLASANPWPTDLPPIVFEDRSLIVTRYEKAVQVSSFVEFNAQDAPPDARKWTRLEKHIRELGLPIVGPFDRWFGARPTLPDYLPAIGRSERAENLIYAFGHQHLGLTLAAITSRLMVALVQHDRPEVELAPFSLNRFARNHQP